jgi:PAT family beta-lactamase induction signal transducer AmpG
MTIFYIAQGLPIGLFLTAIAAWLASNGRSAADVAWVVSMTYMPWSFKFIAAAIMDRYTFLPMGRRRIWLILSQALMLAGFAIVAAIGPTPDDAILIAILGLVVFTGSAVQDVAVDGLAVDILPDEEQGPASSYMFGGQALGIAGGAAIGGYMLEYYGSTATFLAFMPLNVGFLLLAIALRERPGERLLPWSEGQASSEALEKHGIHWLQIFAITFRSVIKRDSILLLVASALGRAVAGAFTAFWPVFATTEAGYSTSAYSSMYATVGLIISIACMWFGAVLIRQLGPRLACIVTFAGYALIAVVYLFSPEIATIGYVFVILTIYWNATDTLTTVSGNPLRMRLSDKRVGATQFTIYNSLGNLPVPIGASIYAWAMGEGGIVYLMPILIVMIVFSGVIFAMMRVGAKALPGDLDHLGEPQPRMD